MAFLENPQQIKCEDKELIKIIERLYEYTDIKVEKTQKLEKETIELFKEFEDKFETKRNPFYHFFKGRYFA